MAGYPLRVGDSVSSAKEIELHDQLDSEGVLAQLRGQLIRLSLDTHTPESLLAAALDHISKVLKVSCDFVEGSVLPEPGPGQMAAVVYADDVPMGALILSALNLQEGVGREALQELADLVGVGLINASQAQAVAELQNDSEDMLYYAPDAIFVLFPDGKVEMANQKALALVDSTADAVLGKKLKAVLNIDHFDMRRVRETAANGGVMEVETHSTAGTRLAALTLSYIGDGPSQILCVIRDITAERQAQLALRRSERNVLMGQTVEYLLHEVNNPLAALLGNLGVAQKRHDALVKQLKDGSSGPFDSQKENRLNQLYQLLKNAETSAQRIKNTMSSLRSVHVGGHLNQLSSVDVRAELRMAIGMIEQESKERVPIKSELDTSTCMVTAPPLAIAEAVAALLKNAYQAVEDREDGIIHVRARQTDDAVIISIVDNGPGVDEAISERIFMPFFTTKPIRQALGLGLSVAEDAVRRIGGTLSLVHTEDTGAVFELTLPIEQAISSQ